ncbi:MAG: RNA polymerase sigma factor [Bdellovibrionota bacterium]|nr:RNA polymerase sigma factor [Bdellovibrionota bacterium]
MINKALQYIGLLSDDSDSKLRRFQTHYNETKDFVRTIIYWIVRSEVTEDLIQETYLKAWQRFDSFEERSSFKTWVYTIARNTAFDYLRKSKTDLSLMKFGQEELAESIVNNDETRKDLITKGLSLLDDNGREVFILYFKLGLTQAEISELLKIPQGTVKSRLHTAKNKFKDFLKENGVDHE